MAAIDDLKAAVEHAVAEMQAAADIIKNNPNAGNDQELADLAARFENAANALDEASPEDDTPPADNAHGPP